MKKEIASLVLNSLSSNPVMIERAALMQERWGNVNLDEIATPIIKRVLIDLSGIQKFLEEKYPGIKFSHLGIEITNQKFEPVLSFKEEHEDFWTAKSSERWYSDEYSFEEKDGTSGERTITTAIWNSRSWVFLRSCITLSGYNSE